MKLRALDSFHHSGVGTLKRNDVFEVSDYDGKDLIDRGLAEEMVHRPNPNKPPITKVVTPPVTKTPGQSDDPLSHDGFPIGPDKPSSSSAADHLQKPARLKMRRTRRGSSRSTKGSA